MAENLAYQENVRTELINGQIVAMSPRPAFNHNRTAFRVAHIFERNLEGRRCTAIADGTDLYLTRTNHFVPDMMVVCDRSKIHWNGVHGAPDLVVEVLSPGTAKYDRSVKLHVYEACGVGEYWIADPANRSIEQYLLEDGRYELHAVYTSYPDYVLEAMEEEDRAEVVTRFRCSLFDDFEIDVDEVFCGLLA